MAKKYFWFKMQEDFFKSKEIKKLRKIAGGDTYTIIYQKMILLSIRTNGKIFYEGIEDSFADEIALEIDEDPDNVKVTLNYIIKNHLVDVMSDTELVVNEAIKNIGTQDESTERVRLHRERKKELALHVTEKELLVTDNALHVTNETTEIDKEIEKDKEKTSTLQHEALSSEQKKNIFIWCYEKKTKKEYRKIKKEIIWNDVLCDIDREDYMFFMESFFGDESLDHDNLTIEYFNTIVNKYC